MIPTGWAIFAISEVFLVSAMVLFQLNVKSPAIAYYDLGMWLCSVIAMWTLGRAMAHFDLSTLFALWLGVGILAVSIVSLLLLREELSFWKSASIAATALGIVGLILTSPGQ